LGAREEHFANERVVELLFECEGQPAMVVIAQKGGEGAKEIEKAIAAGRVPATRSVAGVTIAVIGTNTSKDLIHVVDDQWPAPPEAMKEESATPVIEPDSVTPPDATAAPVVILPEETNTASPPEEAPQEQAPEVPPNTDTLGKVMV